jgi:anti-sigma B factor antagonist
MAVVSETEQGKCRLRIESDMTIYTALELKQELMPSLDKGQNMEVDLSLVNEMDSAGLQLLVMLKREAATRGMTLALTAHSPAVTSVLDTFNMAAYFGDPIVLPDRHAA